MEHLADDDDNKAPWTFTRLTEGLGGNEFEDISRQIPTEQEWQDDQDDPMAEVPAAQPPATPRRRLMSKRPEPSTSSHGGGGPKVQRTTGANPPDFCDEELFTQQAWYSMTTEESRQEACGKASWIKDQTMVEIEINPPNFKKRAEAV